MGFHAVLDANVLVGARRRDVLLTVAECGIYAPMWSGEILHEMQRHVPATLSSRLVPAMQRAFPDADRGHWPGMATAVQSAGKLGVNPKGRHVLALAICGHADVVVTDDAGLREELERVGVEAQPTSAFAAYAVDVDVERARAALVDMARRRWQLGGTDEEVLARVEAWGKAQPWSWTLVN